VSGSLIEIRESVMDRQMDRGSELLRRRLKMKTNRTKISRKRFIKRAAVGAGGLTVARNLVSGSAHDAWAQPPYAVYTAKNGTPAQNVARVIEMRYGSIANLVGPSDVVVISPNGQWKEQGGTNTACMMGLIDLILDRPGGFSGEIIVTENIHRPTGQTGNDMWTTTPVSRNGPSHFLDMIQYYNSGGHANVTAARLNDYDRDSYWKTVTGPSDGEGWVRDIYTASNAVEFYIPYPVFQSMYSLKYIDLKNGVWGGTYTGQPPLKFIKMPTLNNHGHGSEDYAGVTSAVKSFLGITELENRTSGLFDDGKHNMHGYHGGSFSNRQFITGEVIGAWLLNCRVPDAFITTAEWVGWGSREGSDATQAKTVGLCNDPVTLDYYMCKHVLYPTHTANAWLDPDNSPATNHTRQTLEGCMSKGFGTLDEAEIVANIYDFAATKEDVEQAIENYMNNSGPGATRDNVDRAIRAFKEGSG